jgi:PAS domain S-box-containing protein
MLEESTNQTFGIESNKLKKTLDGRYKTLFEQINAAAFLTDLNGKILEANLKSCELLGYNLEEIMDNLLINFFPKTTDWSQLIEEISSKGGLNFEAENVKKDGTIFPVEISTSLFIMDKKPVMFALIWDITNRKKAEKEIKESQEKYEGLFECTTDAMIVLDARGSIIDANSRSVEMLGINKDEFIGNNFLNMDILTPKSLSIVVNQFQELLSNKIATSQETEIIIKDGKLMFVELSSFFLVKKENEVDNFVLVIRDISDRKQTEIKLAREHELLQTLMDSIPDSIYFKDTDNKFIMVNKAKAANSNVKAEDMIGKTDYDFLPNEEAEKAFNDDKEIMDTGKFIVNQIEKLTNMDGSERWVSVTKIPRFDREGNIIGTMGISRDITEWKKLEDMVFKEIK